SAGTDWIDCVGGTPGTVEQDWFNESSFAMSTLSAVDFLKIRKGFNTYLNALETAGLTEMLANGKPYLLYAPSDEAFAALPKDQLDALMSDPQALADLLRYHIVEGYYPYGTLPGRKRPGQRIITNLQGTDLELHDDGTINGIVVEDESFMVRNGTRVKTIGQVLQPPEE
ncbi:MAG: fasciclin domain-containing protein, partial [Deinococcota bacterium]|nr:fasciclin domain-containing protein [Deinococcota bacterium]